MKLADVDDTSGFSVLTSIRRHDFDSNVTLFSEQKNFRSVRSRKKSRKIIAVTGAVKHPVNRTVNRG